MPRLTCLLGGLLPLALLNACASLAPGGATTAASQPARSVPVDYRAAPTGYTVSKQIRYSFTVRNVTNQLMAKAEFWTYAPVPQTSHQWRERLVVSEPYQASRDALGNEVLHFEFANLPPYATKIIRITADLKMAPQPVDIATGDLNRFTRSEPYIESGDARLAELARRLHGDSTMATVRRAYDWAVANVKSQTYLPEERGALYAVTERTGDCTEFADLVTALSRANQIPARPVGGYVFPGNAIVQAMDYHNWTEFFAEGHWQIVDAQKQAFTKNQTDYIAMQIIAADLGGALGNAHRFRYAGDGLQIVMN